MDPLSLTVSVSSLLVTAAQIIKAAAALRSNYRDASFMLSAIASECTVINTSLVIMQGLMISDQELLRSRMTDSILSTFEVAITGCTLTMSVIEEELKSLLVTDGDGNLKARRVKYILEQTHLEGMLQQIRGQQTGVSLLLTAYQLDTNAEVIKMTNSNNILLQQIADRGRKYYVESIHDSARYIGVAFSAHSTRSSNYEMSSTIDSREFVFDDQCTSTAAYRNALASLQHKHRLLSNVQRGEARKSVQAHKVDPGQPERTSSHVDVNTSSNGPTTSSHLLNLVATDHVETTIVLSSSESIHTHRRIIEDSFGNSSDQSVIADLDLTQSPAILHKPWPLPTPERFHGDETTQGSFEDLNVQNPDIFDTQGSLDSSGRSVKAVERYDTQDPEEAPIEEVAPNSLSWTRDSMKSRDSSDRKSQTTVTDVTRLTDSGSTGSPPRTPLKVICKLKLVMLGDSFSGKTYALMRHLRGDTYGISRAPTVCSNYTSDMLVDDRHYQIDWTDTPGQEGYDNIRPLAYTGCHVALLMFSIDSPDSFANIKEKWAREIFHYQPLVPKILVGCKTDLRYDRKTLKTLANTSEEPVSRERGEAFASCLGYDIQDLGKGTGCKSQMKYMECSALTGEGIDELFLEAARLGSRYAEDCAKSPPVNRANTKRKRISGLLGRSQTQLLVPT